MLRPQTTERHEPSFTLPPPNQRGRILVTPEDRANHPLDTDHDIIARRLLAALTAEELLKATQTAKAFEAVRHGVAQARESGLPHPAYMRQMIVQALLRKNAITHAERKRLEFPANWPS